jgi:hypothetical protein
VSAKISIIGQIAEAERELAMRHEVYPRRVANRQMRNGEADMLIARQEAIIKTLKWVQANEPEIRAWLKANRVEVQ